MAKNEHIVYMLKCSDGTFYTGYTNNLQKRLRMHEQGKGAKYTRGRGPFVVELVEHFETKSDALRREYAVKRLKRHEKEQLIRRYKEEG